MRVALLSYNAQTGDAIGNQVAEKLTFFLERGADVRVFVESDVALHPLVRPYAKSLRPEPHGEAWDFLAAADLAIFEYGQYYELLTLLPLLAGGKPRILIDYHGVTPPELWSGHNREALEQGVLHRGVVWYADAVLAHSACMRRELQGVCRLPAERVQVLGFPLDRELFRPGPSAKDPRQTLGLKDATVLLYVGRPAPNKGLPVFVEALARLRDVTPAVHALIVGKTSDLYQHQKQLCEQLARERGVADRLHFLGPRTGAALGDVYRAADIFVTPSRWESFCIPVIEAMACGVPVVAARNTALPETVADAGLTFRTDDADDLARQVRRVLASADCGLRIADCQRPSRWAVSHATQFAIRNPQSAIRIAVTSFRYGTDFVGGAETSLRTIADHLHRAGHRVEVFTTCTRGESVWKNELPQTAYALATAGAKPQAADVPVYRFRIDPHDRARHLASFQSILHTDGRVSAELEQEYVRHSIHSGRLVQRLRERIADFDAVIVGPYLFGLTHDVAAAFPDKTVLLPCFHDEPLARLGIWQRVYGDVAGIWYHSAEERALAEQVLGLNHPGAVDVTTTIQTQTPGDAEAGRRLVGAGTPYLVYCGRYSGQKQLPLVFDFARRYDAVHPGRFRFVFMGQGEVRIPRAPWAMDLGFVDEQTKRDVLAGAAALVQLSRLESLSLVALEAWAQKTPLIASAVCAVLAGHLTRCGGGRSVADFADFARALHDLWENPDAWRTLGRQGQAYVRAHYGTGQDFTKRLESALAELRTPLRQRMRLKGLERAARFDRAAWREQFGRVIDRLLHDAPRRQRMSVEIHPLTHHLHAAPGNGRLLVPVRLTNRATLPLMPHGPGRSVVRCEVLGQALADQTTLPGLLIPGATQTLAVAVPVPQAPGTYRTHLAVRCGEQDVDSGVVIDLGVGTAGRSCSATGLLLLDDARTALAEAHDRQQLPDDYVDVSEGWFARCKRWIKGKLLGNFKHAYVDVLSRQQSQVNRRLVSAVQQLADCCATLDHAVRELHDRLSRLDRELADRACVADQVSPMRNPDTVS